MWTNRDLGKWGEDKAVEFIQRRGYKVVERNYKNIIGEIDIIAKDEEDLCFIEVKSRSDNHFGSPLEAVTSQKQWKIARVAQWYLQEKRIEEQRCRFDVVSILLNNNELTSIEIIKDAFDLP